MKHVLVVGATDGIGLALCNNYLPAGWRVALVGEDPVNRTYLLVRSQTRNDLLYGTNGPPGWRTPVRDPVAHVRLGRKLGLHRDNTAGDLLAPDYSSLPSDPSPLAPRQGSMPTPFGGRTSLPKASTVVYAKRTHHG